MKSKVIPANRGNKLNVNDYYVVFIKMSLELRVTHFHYVIWINTRSNFGARQDSNPQPKNFCLFTLPIH